MATPPAAKIHTVFFFFFLMYAILFVNYSSKKLGQYMQAL